MATEKEEPLQASLLGGGRGGSTTLLFVLLNSLVEKDNSKLLDGTDAYMEEALMG